MTRGIVQASCFDHVVSFTIRGSVSPRFRKYHVLSEIVEDALLMHAGLIAQARPRELPQCHCHERMQEMEWTASALCATNVYEVVSLRRKACI